MTILFYRRAPEGRGAAPGVPPGLTLRLWKPAEHGLPPAGSRRLSNYAWWAFDRLGGFPQTAFAELTLWRGLRLVHRLILTPRWARFPFMARSDLQLGDLWTAPDERGGGLATLAMETAHALIAGRGVDVWYVTDAGKAASIRLAEKCGYKLVGSGRRTRPLGLGLFGRFRLDIPVT